MDKQKCSKCQTMRDIKEFDDFKTCLKCRSRSKKWNDAKLIKAVEDRDIEKIKKYLDKKADPCVNDAQLFFEAIWNDDQEILKLLVKYAPECTREHRSLVKFACQNNRRKCFNILFYENDNNDLSIYKQTDTLGYIKDFISVSS